MIGVEGGCRGREFGAIGIWKVIQIVEMEYLSSIS